MGVMGGALFNGPVLHNAGHDIGDFQIQRFPLVDGGFEAFKGGAGKAFLHHMLVKYHGTVDFLGVCCHKNQTPFYIDLRRAEGLYNDVGAVR